MREGTRKGRSSRAVSRLIVKVVDRSLGLE
jgi:hypothetical protein